MSTVSLKDAQANFPSLVDRAHAGEFVTIVRHGKPAAVLMSVEAAEAASKAATDKKRAFTEHLLSFPDVEEQLFSRSVSPSREIDF